MDNLLRTMFKRRFNTSNQNNVIIYQSTQREVPKTTVTDALGGWGANYVDSKSTWDSTSGIGYLYFDGTITRIPDRVFEQNSTMIAILHIPETVTSIGEKVFYFNETGTSLRSKLTGVNFNTGLKFIGARAFQQNRQLEKAILPNSINYLYDFVFNGCAQKLSEVTFGENFLKFINTNTNINNDGHGFFGVCENLKTIYWNAINCGDFPLYTNSPFTTESIFDRIYVDSSGNADNTKNPIKNVYFGNKVEHIPACMFWKCYNIQNTIEIPETCTRIGDRAFQECIGIREVKIYAKIPPLITPVDYEQNPNAIFGSSDGKNAVFRQFTTSWIVMPNLSIYVPSESLNAYKTDKNWSVYTNIIKPLN